MTSSPPTSTRNRRSRRVLPTLLATALVVAGGVAFASPAQAAGERVDTYLTTTTDSNGRTVSKGLEQQAALSFTPGSASGGTTISVDSNAERQVFEGAGASITGATAELFTKAISASKRDEVMRKLFSPTDGIGLSFVRNPIGVSDLSPEPKDDVTGTMDDTCCDLNDFGPQNNNDDQVRSLTKQAQDLNPALRVKVVPWTAPAWMKSNALLDDRGWLKWEYAPMYAQYLVKYIQRYQQAGIEVDYVSVSNEPNCACGNPGMEWNADGMNRFIRDNVYPALRAAGIKTKVLIHDWNYQDIELSRQTLDDPAVRNGPLFGGIAWHGYTPAFTSTGTDVHNQYPNVPQFSTEYSGGDWITNQHDEDMTSIVSYARNWSSSVVKWSLALDQNRGPYNQTWSTQADGGKGKLTGCTVCTGLVTVQNGGARAGQVDYTVEYYTTGHLTKFVKPGAKRIDSTNTNGVINVAYKNADGTIALIAHNSGGSAQTVNINWSGQKVTTSLPAHTSATYVWKAGVGGGGTTNPPTTGTSQVKHTDGGRCMEVAGGVNANGTAVQLWDCDANNANQKWTFASNGTITWNGKCLGVAGGAATDGAKAVIWNCDGAANQKWTRNSDGTIRSMGKCLDVTDGLNANGTKLQIWGCSSGPNQRWT